MNRSPVLGTKAGRRCAQHRAPASARQASYGLLLPQNRLGSRVYRQTPLTFAGAQPPPSRAWAHPRDYGGPRRRRRLPGRSPVLGTKAGRRCAQHRAPASARQASYGLLLPQGRLGSRGYRQTSLTFARSAAASVPRLGSPAGLRRAKAEAKAAAPKSRPRDEGGPPLCPAPRSGFGSASQLWASATSKQPRIARLPPNISDLRSQRSRLRPAFGLTRGTTAGQGGERRMPSMYRTFPA